MLKNTSDKNNQNIDYNKYEQLLQKISSVPLENITSLKSTVILLFDESCKIVSDAYYRKIQDLIQNFNEEE